MSTLSAPSFNTRVPVQFISADEPTLSICAQNNNLLQNNPAVHNINAGVVSKSDQGADGLNYLRGLTEYAPISLELQWNQLSISDYMNLCALQPYWLTFISYRNLGYYGRLVLQGPQSAGTKTADVIKLKGLFMVQAPSDANGAQTINRLATPTALSVISPPSTPNAPTVVVNGTAGSTQHEYIVIARNTTGDSLGSSATTITTSNATLSATNFNAVSWSAVTGATTYIVLRDGLQFYSGSDLTVNDTGQASSAYSQLQAGAIAAGFDTYYWLTFSTRYGETPPYGVGPFGSGAGYTSNSLSWTWPSSVYCEKASVYVGVEDDPTQSMLLGEVPNGLTATWVDYVGYQGTLVNRQPPSVNQAYRGAWQGGIWFNEIP